MRIFCISFSSYDNDGRLKSLVNMISKKHKIDVFAPIHSDANKHYENITFLKDHKNKNLFGYIFQFFEICLSLYNSNHILVNNRKAASLVLFLYIFIFRKKITYDMREFYEFNLKLGIRNYIGTCIEHFFILSCVDIIICANQDRKRLLKVKIKKNLDLVVVENIRKLPIPTETKLFSSAISVDRLNTLKALSNSKIVNIISTDGLSHQRETLEVINACRRLTSDVHLHIFGRVSKNSEDILSYLATSQNITFYGPVSHQDLSLILQLMDAGIVRYHNEDRNNRYCASGKLYEFIYAGLPVLCSANPPLKKFINDTGVGVADTNFDRGISTLLSSLDVCKDNVQKYISNNIIEHIESKKLELLEETWKV